MSRVRPDPANLVPWIMKKQTVIPGKRRAPAATGQGEPVVLRMKPPQLKALDDWISKQKPPFPSRPAAVRRLVDIALSSGKRREAPYPQKTVAKARVLASKAIDSLMDPATPVDEKAVRKHRLLKGPSDFRDVRVDREK